jgi:hypothetical protein
MNASLNDFLNKINFEDPRLFDFSQKCIDVRLRKVLPKINQSQWCWTLFSCQGHSHNDKSYSLPYFVFIVRNEYKEKLINLIIDTIDNDTLSLKLPIHNPHSVEISLGYYDQNFSIISAHWSISHLKMRGKLKVLHNKFEVLADRILEKNYG